MFRILLNPTYNGTVTYNTITNYGVEYGLGTTTNTVSAMGTILKTGSGDQQSTISFDLKSAIRLGASLSGTADEIIIAVKPHSVNLDIHRGVNWRELA